MGSYFLGVDIGGSKSRALIADTQGNAIGCSECGPGNYESVGRIGFHDALHLVTNEVLMNSKLKKEHISGAGFGIAGYDWYGEYAPIKKTIESLGLNTPYEFVNDAKIGFLSGCNTGYGIGIVAGTGCNCYGRNIKGIEFQMTGCGDIAAEYGGAYSIVSQAVKMVSLAFTGRGDKTKLTEALLSICGAKSVIEMLKGLKNRDYLLPPQAANEIFDIAYKGDKVANNIIAWSGSELGKLANCVIRRLGLEHQIFEVILIGSLFKGKPTLLRTLKPSIHAVAPRAILTQLDTNPTVGGVLLAMKATGLKTKSIKNNLINTSNQLF